MTASPPREGRHLGATTLLGVAGVLIACTPDDELPLPPVVWEGDMVRVRMDDPDIEVCGGTFEALDRHAALVRQALLLEGDGLVEYSIGDQDFVDRACASPDRSPAACADTTEGHVFSIAPFVSHEIVHAVRRRDPSIGSLSSPFEEGLAMVYGDDFLPSWPIALDVVGLFETTGSIEGEQQYYYSGHMVAKLLDLHGVETFRRFDMLARDQDEDTAFSEVFGEPKEEFALYAEADPVCEQTQWWMPLLQCDGEPIVADPQTGAVTLTGDLRCDGPEAIGPGAGEVWVSRHFRLDARTTSILTEIDMPEDSTLEVVGCTGGCPDRFAYHGTRYQVGSVANGLPDLEPGEYFLRMSRPSSDTDGRFRVVFR